MVTGLKKEKEFLEKKGPEKKRRAEGQDVGQLIYRSLIEIHGHESERDKRREEKRKSLKDDKDLALFLSLSIARVYYVQSLSCLIETQLTISIRINQFSSVSLQ